VPKRSKVVMRKIYPDLPVYGVVGVDPRTGRREVAFTRSRKEADQKVKLARWFQELVRKTVVAEGGTPILETWEG
jgi:hypothetical protein